MLVSDVTVTTVCCFSTGIDAGCMDAFILLFFYGEVVRLLLFSHVVSHTKGHFGVTAD
jgi:hypothetical protein